MALINCPECGREGLSSRAQQCPQCAFPIGEYLEEQARQHQREQEARQAAQAAEIRRQEEEANKQRVGIGCLVILGLLGSCCVFTLFMDACEDRRERQELAQLEEELPDHLEEVEQKLEAGNLRRASARLNELQNDLGDHEKLEAAWEEYDQVFVEIKTLELEKRLENGEDEDVQELRDIGAELMRRGSADDEKISSLNDEVNALYRQDISVEKLKEGREHLEKGETNRELEDWLTAERGFKDGLAALDEIHEDYVRSEHEDLRDELQAGLTSIADEAEEVRARMAEKENYREECGPKPEPSAWDGHLPPVRHYLERRAHDPSSITFEGCTEPVLTESQCWRSQCVYRADNAFGATVRNSGVFYLVGDDSVRGGRVTATDGL